jgi:dihydroneopterin aldolase
MDLSRLNCKNRAERNGLNAVAKSGKMSQSLSKISIVDLEVFYRVGVPDAERAAPQRLLLTVEMETDFTQAAATDDLTATIDYYAVTQRLLKLGEGRSWRLIEKLANDIAEIVLREFKAAAVTVEVKKFIIPETRYVSVQLSRKL